MKRIPIEDLIGRKFGRLTVINKAKSYISPKGGKRRKCLCQCDCGNTAEVVISEVRNGYIQSCGCYHNEQLLKAITKHGLRKHSLYTVWNNMRQRCSKPKASGYKNYGGRGIKVCDEWANDFKVFYNWAMANGWERGLEIDRINNDGNYSPDNCQFIICKLNSRNRRSSKLTLEEVQDIRNAYNLKCFSYTELAKAYGVNNSTVRRIIINEIWT